MPKSLVIGKFFFGDNQALRLIDWSRFEGEVPQFTTSVFWDVFQYINDLSVITLIVPDDAVELFTSDANWSRLNVKAASGIEGITTNNNVARDVYNFKGQYITTLKPGVNAADVLGNGLYIVGGKKMIVRK